MTATAMPHFPPSSADSSEDGYAPARSPEALVDAAYLAALNPEQRDAVETVDGPLLVLAGAGTGKTRVLTTRIAHILMQRKAYPSQILAVTFTNKAAREMVERVEKLLYPAASPEEMARPGGMTSGMWLGTFHSIAARILRRHAERIGLTSSFTILDTDDQIRVIKQLLPEAGADEKRFPPKIVMGILQRWKDLGLTPDRVTASEMAMEHGRTYLKIYQLYQQRMVALNAVDFGDLLLHNLTLFTQHPEVLEEYSRKFRYILVDEYQDTNIAQYLWLRLLALEYKNICCVGDDDQSIYGWRGAEVGNILKFEKDFPGAKTVRLERNYRSTRHILAVASHIIANNRERLGKTLWTEIDGGEKVRVKSCWDDGEEARFVGEEIEDCQRKGESLKQMAILVRAGFQTRIFEERFLTMGIPYKVVGGLRFYERQEIRDAIAYLRLIANADDDLAFERVVNVPKRGVGRATLEQLFTTAREFGTSLSRACGHLLANGEMKGKIGGSLGRFLDLLEQWRGDAEALPLANLTEKVLEESGYRTMWVQEKTPEAQGRLENLKELVRAMGEYESLPAFLEHVSLVTDTENNEQGDMVSLMTLHSAKGLEFNVVFLPGWEEGLFPHQRALDESGREGLEEERRLAYVGITRARKLCTISYAGNRRVYNQWQSSIPSRFVQELPAGHTQPIGGGMFSRNAGYGTSSGGGWGNQYGQNGGNAGSGLNYRKEIAGIFAAAGAGNSAPPMDSSATFRKGMRVFHQKFGYGIVMQVSGDHIEVDFEKSSPKKVMADYIVPAK
jgi:DNA helicase-2/ATP-dependent DNA helicase PcrA